MIELVIISILNVLGYKFALTKTTFKYPMTYVFTLGFGSMGLVVIMAEYDCNWLEGSLGVLISISFSALVISLLYRFAKSIFIHDEKRIFYRKQESYEVEMKHDRIIIAMIFIVAFVLQVLVKLFGHN